MPRATTSLETTRHELRSAPPDGFVVLREMSYGDFLKRRDMGMKMAANMGGGSSKLDKIDLDIVQESVTRFEFQMCIADHNLTDANDRKLNLGRPEDFNKLDPKIGQEISALIDEMIQWENPKSDGDTESGDRSDDTISENGEANDGGS